MIGPPMYKQEQIKALKEKLASEVRSHKRELIRIKEIRAMESNNRRKSFEKLEELQNTYTEMLKTKRDSSLSNSSHTSTEKHSRSKSISPSPLLKHSIYSEDPYSLKTPHTEYSKQTSISPYKIHLDRVSQLQNHAKRILQKEKDPSSVLTRIHEEPELNASTLKKIGDIIVPLRYPVYVPTSTLRKAQNLPPQFVNMTTKTGEVFPVHILGDPTPAYDPLIKVESTLKKAESPIKADGRYKRFDGNESVEAKAYTQFDFSEDSDEY